MKHFSVKYWILLSTNLSESNWSPWNVSSSIHCKLFFDISTYFMEFCSISVNIGKKKKKRLMLANGRERNDLKFLKIMLTLKIHQMWKYYLFFKFMISEFIYRLFMPYRFNNIKKIYFFFFSMFVTQFYNDDWIILVESSSN